jgi:hypothetical protein
VVIPLPRMGEYTLGIERINIELSLRNKLKLCEALEAFFSRGNLPLGKTDDANDLPNAELLEDRVQQALAWCARCAPCGPAGCATWTRCSRSCRTTPCARAGRPRSARRCSRSSRRGLRPILEECNAIHKRVLKGRVWVALHMHAGDGNVHTNIPVNSDDYEMLQTAHEAVARIMVLARSLDGVISGEHGIGITKLEFLTDDELNPFAEYKAKVDPEGRFNKGKLLRGAAHQALVAGDASVRQADLANAYTPSFGLMGHESLIMQQSDIGAIADSVKDCLRCGKCKPVCATHVPRANLLYSPRNKILATSLLIEAFLYEEQTRRGISIKHWEEFEDVADHCTVCHKCLSPCPVKIDFGDVSMNMRNLLRKMGRRASARQRVPACSCSTPPTPRPSSRRMRPWWAWLQGPALGNEVLKLARKQTSAPPATLGTAPIKEQVIHFINKKMPGGLPKKTARALLDIETRTTSPSSATRRPPPAKPRRCSTSPAAARSACSARSAWPRRPCSGMRACRRCCRRATCAAATRSAARASSTRPRRSSPTTGCCSTAWPTR